MIEMIGVFALSLLIGLPLGHFTFQWYQKGVKKRAQVEAQEIIQEARDEAELLILEEKERTQDLEAELWTKYEKEFLSQEEKVELLTESVSEQERDNQSLRDKLSHQANLTNQALNTRHQKLAQFETRILELQKKKELSREEIKVSLKNKAGINADETVEQLKTQFENDHLKDITDRLKMEEADFREHVEDFAKKHLATIIDRFERPYSSERGIPAVYFEAAGEREKVSDPALIKAVQEETGCDIFISPELEFIGVAGFDPVRRELARRVLETILREKRPHADMVKKITENRKRELLRQINKDGDDLMKELKIGAIHPEIAHMMGSLKFRYSFTQNQYYHCGEVGWLAGLIAAEVKTVEAPKARRAGLLHDLGKAMDHAADGGHAVIGAKFIAERGEAADIIHAVKSHHYDETPNTDMAFMVIVADAISGARPGARRSTVESYNQKVTDMENIARSFEGVTDCYILSGGRECRVRIDGRKVNDQKSVELAQGIAQRIEAELTYPGQIKVVVVRETIVQENTKQQYN